MKKPVCFIFGLGLLICSSSLANLSGTDDFNDNVMDPAKWAVQFGDPLTETNSRLQYSGGSGAVQEMLAWIANKGSYVNNWSVSIDTFISVDETSLYDQFVNYGLGVVPPPLNTIFSLELRVGEDQGGSNPYRHAVTAFDNGEAEVFQHQFPLSSDSVRLQISFDASAKVLTSHYDTGGGMTVLTNYDTSTWGMADSDEFTIVVFGWSQDVSPASGEVFGDNFEAIPEPGTLGLMAVAVGGLLLTRSKR
jgi:hypothetical protein